MLWIYCLIEYNYEKDNIYKILFLWYNLDTLKGDEVMDVFAYEEACYYQNNQKMTEVIQSMKFMARYYGIPFEEQEQKLDTILENYHFFVEAGYQSDLDLLLKQKGVKKVSLLHESLYYFFDQEEKQYEDENALLRKPEVLRVEKKDSYIIETRIGTIKVKNAKKHFGRELSLFEKPLIGECFDRTLEFVKEKKDYKAVVSHLPNPFSGEHIHAYAKKEDEGILVDPACNAIFYDHTGDIIEKGNILFEQKYEEMDFNKTTDTEIPKLLQLAIASPKTK